MSNDPTNRFQVERVDFGTESEGPDYFTRGAFQVVDTTTGAIVASFPWSLNEPYLTNSHYRGPDTVTISDDGTEAIATSETDGEERVVLPAGAFAALFDGVPLAHDTDYGALAARIAAEDGPPTDKGWREPAGQWLWKLQGRLGKTPAALSVERHVAAFLDDPNPRRRACALTFYRFLPAAPGAARLWELADTQRDLFAPEFPGCSTGRTLDDEFVKALSEGFRNCDRDERRLRVVRAEAFRPGNREDLLTALLDGDGEWVQAHKIEIARAQPDRWKDLLKAIGIVGTDDQLGSLAATIVADGLATRAEVIAFAKKSFSRAARAQIEHALRIRHKRPVPTRRS